eukprot:IDg23230t1
MMNLILVAPSDRAHLLGFWYPGTLPSDARDLELRWSQMTLRIGQRTLKLGPNDLNELSKGKERPCSRMMKLCSSYDTGSIT